MYSMKNSLPRAMKILYGDEYVNINLLRFLKIRYPVKHIDFKNIKKIKLSPNIKENSVYFMDSNYGWWFYDTEENDINKSITLESKDFRRDTRSPEAINVLRKVLKAKYFIGNDRKTYKVSEEHKKLFLEYIPRIYNFEPHPKILGPITPENAANFKIFTKIKDIIENTFKMDFSAISLPKSNIYEMPHENIIGSKSAFKTRYLAGHGSKLLKEDSKDYFLMGFWGYGTNSYAFYYLRANPKSKIYFRLPYGGAYTDNERAKVLIKNYLNRFFTLEKKLSNIIDHIIIIDSIGESNFEIIFKDGKKFNYRKSFYLSDRNYQEFSEMINKLILRY